MLVVEGVRNVAIIPTCDIIHLTLSSLHAEQQLKMMGSGEGNPLFPVAEVKTEPAEEGEEPGPSGAGQEEVEEAPGPAPSYPQAE